MNGILLSEIITIVIKKKIEKNNKNYIIKDYKRKSQDYKI